MRSKTLRLTRETILRVVHDAGLKSLLVLCALAATTDETSRTLVSIETLARSVGLHRRTVSRYVGRLTELGCISQRSGPGRGQIARHVERPHGDACIEIDSCLLELREGLPVYLVLKAMASGGITVRTTITEIEKSFNASRKTVDRLLRELADRGLIRIRRVSRRDIEISISALQRLRKLV